MPMQAPKYLTPSEQRNESFKSHLLFGFDNVLRITDDGLKSMRDVIALLKKRQAAEQEYSRTLDRIHQQFSELVPSTSRIPIDSSTNDVPSGIGLANVVGMVLDELNTTAQQHDLLSTHLTNQVIEELSTCYKETETYRKHQISEGQRLQKQLQDTYTSLKKAQSAHNHASKEADEAKAALDKARTNPSVKSSTLNKLDGKSVTAEGKAAESKLRLEAQELECKHAQESHYNEMMPAVLEQLEIKEEDRCWRMRQSLMRAACLTRDCSQATLAIQTKMARTFERANVRVDLEEAIRAVSDSNDDDDLPVTSVVAPTLKAHLQAKGMENLKPFKDYLFMIVRHKRRLYQYESDNAQRPKLVITLPYGNTIVRPVDDSLFSRPYVFQVISALRTLCVACPDEATYRTWFNELQNLCQPQLKETLAARPHLVRSLQVKVVEAKNLPKSSDYVAEILLDTERQARTQVRSNTNEPYWGQDFEFDHVPLQMTKVVVQIIRVPSNFGQAARQSAAVFKRRMAQMARTEPSPRKSKGLVRAGSIGDERSLQRDKPDLDVIGQAEIELNQAGGTSKMEGWRVLLSPAGDQEVGSVRLGLIHTDEYVRPGPSYDHLRGFIYADHPQALPLLQVMNLTVDGSDRVALGQTLMAVAHHNHCLLEYILAMLQAEVTTTVDANTLFRGNSIASKALDDFMKQLCIHQGNYLEDTLGVHVQSIYDLKSSCELDPTRIQAADMQKELAANASRLANYCSNILKSIITSLDTVPAELRYILHHLYEMIRKQFPQDVSAPRTAVVGFFFLRLICPALLNPQLFGLQDDMPEGGTARSLTLMSKLIQNLANGVTFGQKEAYLTCMNPFIEKHMPAMRDSIKVLCQKPTQPNPGWIQLQPAPRCLAALHRLLQSNSEKLQSVAMADDELRLPGQALLEAVADLDIPSEDEIAAVLQAEEQYQQALARRPTLDLAARDFIGTTPSPENQQSSVKLRTRSQKGLSQLLKRRTRAASDGLQPEMTTRSEPPSPSSKLNRRSIDLSSIINKHTSRDMASSVPLPDGPKTTGYDSLDDLPSFLQQKPPLPQSPQMDRNSRAANPDAVQDRVFDVDAARSASLSPKGTRRLTLDVVAEEFHDTETDL
eukprot:TRINITY_DN11840_c0_g1_i2.p1 TRINITY_DN11840_c0_g1~~TRINITY_DN11840_c0_g1_i2.p1  ORF type:complete len:1122 (+),score=292.68 TRINITY_DN11840_c0_g1_i2:129-3494(+)